MRTCQAIALHLQIFPQFNLASIIFLNYYPSISLYSHSLCSHIFYKNFFPSNLLQYSLPLSILLLSLLPLHIPPTPTNKLLYSSFPTLYTLYCSSTLPLSQLSPSHFLHFLTIHSIHTSPSITQSIIKLSTLPILSHYPTSLYLTPILHSHSSLYLNFTSSLTSPFYITNSHPSPLSPSLPLTLTIPPTCLADLDSYATRDDSRELRLRPQRFLPVPHKFYISRTAY